MRKDINKKPMKNTDTNTAGSRNTIPVGIHKDQKNLERK